MTVELLAGNLWQEAQDKYLEYVYIRKGSDKINLRPNTRDAYAQALRLFFLGHPDMLRHQLFTPLRPWEVRPEDAQTFQQAMLYLGLANRTINQRLAALDGFYKFVRSRHKLQPHPEYADLVTAGLLHWADSEQRRLLLWPANRANPFDADLVDRQEIDAYDHKFFPSAEEMQTLLACIDRTTVTGQRDYALLVTITTTARRVSEVLNLKWGDLRPGKNNDYVFPYRGKGGHILEANLGPQAHAAIAVYLETAGRSNIKPDHYIFIGHEKREGELGYWANPTQPLSYNAARTALKKYADLANVDLKRAHLHGLRHRGAQDYIETQEKKKGAVDYHKLQKKLGHRHLDVTMVYASKMLETPVDESLTDVEKIYITEETNG